MSPHPDFKTTHQKLMGHVTGATCFSAIYCMAEGLIVPYTLTKLGTAFASCCPRENPELAKGFVCESVGLSPSSQQLVSVSHQ